DLGLHHLVDDRAALARLVGGGDDELIGLQRVVGVLLDGARELLDRGGRRLQRGRLVGGALGQRGVVAADLRGGAGHRGRAGPYGGDELEQLVAHAAQRVQQFAVFVAAVRFIAAGQVAGGDAPGGRQHA